MGPEVKEGTLFVGASGVGMGLVYDWNPGIKPVVSWHPSPASLEKARQAPVSNVPIGHMQAQHLRGFRNLAAEGLDYSRLLMGSWDIPGRCDIRAMTYIINAHLRRHETYRSWFEFTDSNDIVRHTIADPADIEFVPVKHGKMTPTELHNLMLATPDPLQWNCFSFGVVQHSDHFTFYVTVDHIHTDPTMLGLMFIEFHSMYGSLVAGAPPMTLPPPGSFDDYCVRHHEYTSSLTLDSPEVRRWIDFSECNDGSLPTFPLPLGDTSVACGGDMIVERLMDARHTAQFEAACMAEGARFSGGLFTAVALAHHNLTGAETYYGLTPVDKRSTPAEYLTTGWFTGVVPFTVPISSFGDMVRAAQNSFDSNADLARVPFDRVVELAPWLKKPGQELTMLNYMDAGLPPLSSIMSSHLGSVNAWGYCDGRTPAHVYMSVGRLFDETSLAVFFPNNPVARESAIRHVEAVKAACHRIARGLDGRAPIHHNVTLKSTA